MSNKLFFSPDDYVPITTLLTFTTGNQTDCISFNVTNNDVTESPKSFTISVGSAAMTTITILDRDGMYIPIYFSQACESNYHELKVIENTACASCCIPQQV